MTPSSTLPTLKDYLTGTVIPDVGAENNRQLVLRFLVEKKGYTRDALWVDAPLRIQIGGSPYTGKIDLIVKAGVPLSPIMAFKCCAGSLGSREREILAAARIFGATPIPLAVVTDGHEATILNTTTGKPWAQGLAALPSPTEAARLLAEQPVSAYPQERLEREKLVFRTYDQDNVNIIRPPEQG
jgi:hypothetical protein